MPELPEVEAVRRSLQGAIADRCVHRVEVRRADVVTGDAAAASLLAGCVIQTIDRLGKELAIIGVGNDGATRCVCVHLGMSGSLCWVASDMPGKIDRHVHIVWHMDHGQMLFRDPRRFGGVWSYACLADRDAYRWSLRGEDALTITPERLHARLSRTTRPIKAVLLDQTVVAGVGNIYADELLFAAGVHPLTPGQVVDLARTRCVVTAMRRILRQAIEAGGSTLRDGGYVNGDGAPGRFQSQHRVYGRSGCPCLRCKTPLSTLRLSARTTVFCPTCQTGPVPMMIR
jgi:formamidopyrimidine-DNA glycosylase